MTEWWWPEDKNVLRYERTRYGMARMWDGDGNEIPPTDERHIQFKALFDAHLEWSMKPAPPVRLAMPRCEEMVERYKTSERYVYGWVDPRLEPTRVTWLYRLKWWWRLKLREWLKRIR